MRQLSSIALCISLAGACMDTDRLVSVIPAKQMIHAVNTNVSIPGYLSALPDHLREYYKQGNNQNPILVLTKLKKTISYEADN